MASNIKAGELFGNILSTSSMYTYNIVGNNLRAIFNFLQFSCPGYSAFPIHIYYMYTCYHDTEIKLKCFHLMINISTFLFFVSLLSA